MTSRTWLNEDLPSTRHLPPRQWNRMKRWGGKTPELRRIGRARSAFVDVFEIGVAVEAFLVKAEEAAAFLVGHAGFAKRRFHVAAKLGNQRFRRELHVVQYFANRIPLDH